MLDTASEGCDVKQLLVVAITISSLSPLAGRLQAQGNPDSLTVNGGVSFINPGIPTVPDAEANSQPIPRLPDGKGDLTGPWVRGGTVADIESDGASPAATIRERMESHRVDPVCATCHSIMDPLGFALESFDAVGALRTRDEKGNPVDDSGAWPSGLEVNGFAGLRAMLLDQSEQFVNTVTGKLMTYALGRRLEYYDQPAVRRIVSNAEQDEYHWSSIIVGIVESPGFLMRARSIQ